MLSELNSYHQERLAVGNACAFRGRRVSATASLSAFQKEVALLDEIILLDALGDSETQSLAEKEQIDALGDSEPQALDEKEQIGKGNVLSREVVENTVCVASSNPAVALPVLRNICRTSDGQKKCAEAGGIDAIIAIVASRMSLNLALTALEAATMLNTTLQELALAAGVVNVLVEVLKDSYEPSIVSVAASCVSVISYRSEACQKSFVDAGAADELVRHLNNYPNDASVQRAACLALYRLACEEGPLQQKVCATMGLEEAMLHAAERSMSDEACWFKMKNFFKHQHGGA